MRMEKLKNLHYVQALFVALATSVFLTLIVPVQTFLGNKDMFKFSLWEVVAEALPATAFSLIVILSLLLLSELVFRRFLYVVVVAVLLCAYLETGILSIGLPPLNGEIRAFQNPFRAWFDAILLSCVFLLIVAMFKWVSKVAHWIALGVLVMAVASLFDVKQPENELQNSSISSGFCPQLDVVESLRFSPKRNIIVLILDSTPAVIASKVAKDNPEIQNHFPGFIAFENNMAMHEMTVRGLPGLMTGKFLSPDISTFEYSSSMFGEDSLLIPYIRTGNPVYFAGASLSYGYTNRRLGDFSKIDFSHNKEKPVFLRNSEGIPYVSLLDVVRFRLVPYKYKAVVLANAYAQAIHSAVKKNWGQEDVLYPLISAHPLSKEDKTTLSVLHTVGIHGPIIRDRHGKRLPQPTQEVSAHYEYGEYVMARVGAFLDDLKKKGIYDNSFIMLVADHGLIVLRKGGLNADGSDGHGAESSVMWIKPIGASGNMKFKDTPTSNCKIAELVKAAKDRDLDEAEISDILYTKERHFIAKHGSRWWSFGRRLFFYEWIYDENGQLVSYKDLGIFKAN